MDWLAWLLSPSVSGLRFHNFRDVLIAANIPETMKTRLQLQGELAKDPAFEKVYKNVGDVFKKTWRNEGLRGLQRGLIPAYGYQVLLNGSRLGTSRR